MTRPNQKKSSGDAMNHDCPTLKAEKRRAASFGAGPYVFLKPMVRAVCLLT